MSQRLCPYCDHPNLADAKFCSACGAAMHLAPCPHCGAVNNISSAACYRCHGELPGIGTVEDAPATTAIVAAESPEGIAVAATPAASAGNSRPSLIVVGIIFIAFAAASYYAYRQRSEIGGRDPATPAQAESTPVTGIISRPEAPPPGASKTSAADSPAPPVARPELAPGGDAPAATPAPAVASESATEVRPRRRGSAAVVAPAEPAAAAAPIDRRSIPLPPAAPIANCTDAIAALGLCKLEPKKP